MRREAAGRPARIGFVAVVGLAVSVSPDSGGAQEWRFEALGGQYRYQGSPVGGADGSALLGVRYLDGASWIGALAGVPMTSTDAPWAMLASSLRASRRRRPLELGLHVSAQTFAQGARLDSVTSGVHVPPLVGNVPLRRRGPLGGGVEPSLSGWGASMELTPLVALHRADLIAEARAGVSAFHSDFADQAFDRALGLAQVRVSAALTPTLVLSAEGRSHWAEEGTYPYLGATAFLSGGPVQAWGSIGAWLADGMGATPWALGTAFVVGQRLSLTGSVRRDAFDPLFQTPGRTSWSVGVSIALVRPSPPPAPVPARYEAGVATLALRADEATGTPSVAGDFTDWKPRPMTLRDGQWTLGVRLRPGVYYYAFVASDGSWFVPESVAGRKPDGFGGYVAVLVVG